MLNKFLIACFITVVFTTSCTKKTDQLFDKNVDERLSETLTSYQNVLTTAPGWKLFVYPKGLVSQDIKIGGLTYYLKFTDKNRVTMVSDFSTDIAAIPKESGYRLKALQRPSLIFDTYTYMHIPADPDPEVSFSPTGSSGYGWGTDFNFSFKEIVPKDTMYLEGNFNQSAAVLVKATQAEMDSAFSAGRLESIILLSRAYRDANPYLYLAGNSTNVGVGFDFDNILITFSSVEGTNLVNKTEAFSFTTYGIHLENQVTIGTNTFQDIYWDDVKKVYYILSGSTRVELGNSPTPIITLPLTDIIGNQYTTVSVPSGAGLPNESALFVQKYTAAKSAILAGAYRLRLDDLDFVFNAITKSMVVNAYVYQGTVGPYLCQYSYSYTVDPNGLFKFTKTSQNNNAALIVTSMNNILSYIGSDQFKIEGFSTSSAFLGKLTSQQNPDFFFSGYLY